MESIIDITEGDIPSIKHTCFFCEEKAQFNFGSIDVTRTIISNNKDCFIYNSIPVCEKHAEAFDSLFSGEHDINELVTIIKTKQKRINLRR